MIEALYRVASMHPIATRQRDLLLFPRGDRLAAFSYTAPDRQRWMAWGRLAWIFDQLFPGLQCRWLSWTIDGTGLNPGIMQCHRRAVRATAHEPTHILG